MEALPLRLEFYSLPNGRVPFQDWVVGLSDAKTKRIDHGPGFRLYCGKKNNALVIVLIGGDKKTQTHDIQTARRYWEDFQARSAG